MTEAVDETDRKLIALLRADARAPVARLARAVNLSRGAVQNRIDRLIADGAIAGFTIRAPVEGEALRVRAITSIAVEGERAVAVLKALRGVPEVEAVHTTNGRWDLIAELAADSLAGFSNALDAIRMIDGISATETSLLLRTHRL
jgi:DNA-binding Lrp family transcriptional regulator